MSTMQHDGCYSKVAGEEDFVYINLASYDTISKPSKCHPPILLPEHILPLHDNLGAKEVISQGILIVTLS